MSYLFIHKNCFLLVALTDLDTTQEKKYKNLNHVQENILSLFKHSMASSQAVPPGGHTYQCLYTRWLLKHALQTQM